MKTTEPRASAEIHEIRLRIHAKRRNLTAQEYNRIVHRNATALLKRYGLKLQIVPPERIHNAYSNLP